MTEPITKATTNQQAHQRREAAAAKLVHIIRLVLFREVHRAPAVARKKSEYTAKAKLDKSCTARPEKEQVLEAFIQSRRQTSRTSQTTRTEVAKSKSCRSLCDDTIEVEIERQTLSDPGQT
ncbi:hypothetical protein LTR28_005580 [Elasticomyces elasticus]|nr:hypothetical protein LTR28_005580 [Elasticomyces elasticus]